MESGREPAIHVEASRSSVSLTHRLESPANDVQRLVASASSRRPPGNGRKRPTAGSPSWSARLTLSLLLWRNETANCPTTFRCRQSASTIPTHRVHEQASTALLRFTPTSDHDWRRYMRLPTTLQTRVTRLTLRRLSPMEQMKW
jgi:hypothetical protein